MVYRAPALVMMWLQGPSLLEITNEQSYTGQKVFCNTALTTEQGAL